MNRGFSAILLAFFSMLLGCSQPNPDPAHHATWIPLPDRHEPISGHFDLPKKWAIYHQADSQFAMAAAWFRATASDQFGQGMETVSHPDANLILEKDSSLNPEHYRMEITADGVRITGGDGAAAFYALQSLTQLIEQAEHGKLAGQVVTDGPNFTYRGMHLDVCRHFFPVAFIEQYIDLMARYKMNRFHWHLTEDQGWRIEIKKYPKLQEVAAYRKETLTGHYGDQPHTFDGKAYGGYYTQEEVRHIVAYARQRFITVIPEIEMPGHAQAALAAYPELGCTGGPYEVATKWGVFPEVYCPREHTFDFLEDVLTEVMDLFPSEYIHIGGDECPKTRWKQCDHCQRRIKAEGLADEHELQSYFIQRIEKFVNSKGRKIIGWDEILEGGLAPNATVMSWRGERGGIEAAQQGHDVIMTPTGYCYFDYYQSQHPDEPLAIGGYLPLEKVYHYQPVPEELSEAEGRHILGAQGNVWTEYMPTGDKVWYMAYPRAMALAEVLWTDPGRRDYADFVHRLSGEIMRLRERGIVSGQHIYDLTADFKVGDKPGLKVDLTCPVKEVRIRYRLDSGEVTTDDKLFTGALPIDQPIRLRARTFLHGQPAGRTLDLTVEPHLLSGAQVSLAEMPAARYGRGGPVALVNGVDANDQRYGDVEWLGFEGTDVNAQMTLAEEVEVSSANFRFFNSPRQWIYPPQSVEVFSSTDGAEWTLIGSARPDPADALTTTVDIQLEPTTARHFKIIAKNQGPIPEGKQGAGHMPWLFVDEMRLE